MTVGADEFMYTIFRRAQLGKEHPAICKARQYADGRISYPAEMFEFNCVGFGEPWFFNISTFWVPSPGDRFRARMSHIGFTYAVVLDDVGDHPKSKVSWDALRAFPLKPNYILATREAAGRYNCQAGYILAPTEPVKATRLINAFIEIGLSDPGMRSPNRWARLPGSTKHDSNFPATLLEWNP